MDEGLSDAVKEVFVRLYEEGLIYRGKRLVNWDPKLHTAVSDLEVLNEEEAGHMWHMRYPLSNGRGHLTVSTTRPETLLGDCAVAVSPEDGRYKHLIGELVELPLTGRRIPIIADEHADPEFGTGCVKITPAHDFNDNQVWMRHRDEKAICEQPHSGLINIFTPDAVIRANEESEGQLIPGAYIGMDRYDARKRIVADLQAEGLLERIVDHKLVVPRGDRSGAVIEPYLTDQWYVRVAPLAGPAIAAVESGRIRFVPDNWKNTYYDWMRNIQDWCICRQIWWGHRIPAWYDAEGNVYVGRSEAEVRARHDLPDDFALRAGRGRAGHLVQLRALALLHPGLAGADRATARLLPHLRAGDRLRHHLLLGRPDDHDGPEVHGRGALPRGLRARPGARRPGRQDVQVQGQRARSHRSDRRHRPGGAGGQAHQRHDAAATRPARSKRPRARSSRRASRASAPTPCASPSRRWPATGRDINFDLGRIEGYRNFCNKLWNAARYVLMNTEGQDCGQNGGAVVLSAADRWILSRLQAAASGVREALDGYRFDHAAQAIYEFTWNEYCDWYLELSKTVLTDPSAAEEAQRATRRTLVRVLETLLRLAHPLMPFITEEIWQRVAPLAGVAGATIMLRPFPEPDEALIDVAAVAEMQWVMQLIQSIRRIRGEMNIAPGKPVPVLLAHASPQDLRWLPASRPYLDFLARTESVRVLDEGEEGPESATGLVGDMKVLIPMAGLIDKDAELARLDKEISRLKGDLERTENKLLNPAFVDKAPTAVVQKERDRLGQTRAAIGKLEEQATRIRAL